MRHVVLLAVAACVVVGCSSGDPDSLEGLSDNERAELPVLEHGGVRELIARHEGKVVVLAGWPARMEGYVAFYDGLGALAKPDAEGGPAVVAMNLDGASAVRGDVLPLLRKVKPAFPNCVFNGDQMMLSAVVDPEWGGAVPAIWIYDTKGKLEASFYGEGALDKAKARLEGMATKGGRGKKRRRRPPGEM